MAADTVVAEVLRWSERLITAFAREEAAGAHETLFVVHPERAAMTSESLEGFVRRLDARLQAHPDSAFEVGGVHTRRGPYPSFQVLSQARLKATSDTLRTAGYYAGFSPDMLRAVGIPR